MQLNCKLANLSYFVLGHPLDRGSWSEQNHTWWSLIWRNSILLSGSWSEEAVSYFAEATVVHILLCGGGRFGYEGFVGDEGRELDRGKCDVKASVTL